MFGNIMGAMFFVVVALLPKGRKVELCNTDEGGVIPYIWDRCSSPDLFRGQRPNRNVVWGVTYPATYVRGQKFPFIGEDLGMWGANHTFVELCQYGSPANCVIPPPCTSVHMLCVLLSATTEEELPFVGFFARMGCEDADEVEEQPIMLSCGREMAMLTGEWGPCARKTSSFDTGANTRRMERDRERDIARRIKAEVLGC